MQRPPYGLFTGIEPCQARRRADTVSALRRNVYRLYTAFLFLSRKQASFFAKKPKKKRFLHGLSCSLKKRKVSSPLCKLHSIKPLSELFAPQFCTFQDFIRKTLKRIRSEPALTGACFHTTLLKAVFKNSLSVFQRPPEFKEADYGKENKARFGSHRLRLSCSGQQNFGLFSHRSRV